MWFTLELELRHDGRFELVGNEVDMDHDDNERMSFVVIVANQKRQNS